MAKEAEQIAKLRMVRAVLFDMDGVIYVGNQPLPVQQMQRVADRLARDAELFGELVLPDAVPRRQGAIDDAVENPRIDLVDQVRGRVERDHGAVHFGIRNSVFMQRNGWRVKAGCGTATGRRMEGVRPPI